MPAPDPLLLALCGAGIAGGLWALWRGLVRHRSAMLVSGMSTSRIATLAAGEVRLTGTVEPAAILLRSPLQDRDCVWYRARIEASDRNDTATFAEERGIGFWLRDATGTIRVLPRDARMDLPTRYDASTGLMGDLPPDLHIRRTSSVAVEDAADREAAIAALLTVRPAASLDDVEAGAGGSGGGLSFVGGAGSGGRRFVESRLEPGDLVTIVGSALPFGDLRDPGGADSLERAIDPLGALEDPEIAADLAEARAGGTLLTPEEAWGNAAIPGFGIGRPVREPELDDRAARPVLGTGADAREAAATFDIAPDLLVLASAPGAPMTVALGTPSDVVARDQGAFLLGLLGACAAILSALAGALLLSTR